MDPVAVWFEPDPKDPSIGTQYVAGQRAVDEMADQDIRTYHTEELARRVREFKAWSIFQWVMREEKGND